jgi:hypothetical protein
MRGEERIMKKSENSIKLQRISKRLGCFFYIGTFVLPVFVIFYWLGYNSPPIQLINSVFPGSHGGEMPQVLELNSRLIGLVGDLPALAVTLFSLDTLRRLFFLYAKGVFFRAENVAHYQKLSKLAFWGILANIFDKTLVNLALTINNPPGQRVLTISFTQDHVKLMFVAIILMIIARVMNEGREIYDENQLTV